MRCEAEYYYSPVLVLYFFHYLYGAKHDITIVLCKFCFFLFFLSFFSFFPFFFFFFLSFFSFFFVFQHAHQKFIFCVVLISRTKNRKILVQARVVTGPVEVFGPAGLYRFFTGLESFINTPIFS